MNSMIKRAYWTQRTIVLSSLCGVLLITGHVLASPIAKRDVIAAVETWVRQATADARPDAVVERLEPYVAAGRTAAYIAHLAGGGYCICGADDRLLPVYLYRPIGTFDQTNRSYAYILQDIARRLDRHDDAARATNAIDPDYAPTLTRRAEDWAQLRSGQVPASYDQQAALSGGDPTMMALPTTSYWHQGSPYNDQCPELIPGTDDHCVVGCVATTAAQIMYYWEWPNTGVGSDSVTYDRRHRADWDYEALTTNPGLNLDEFWDDRLYWTSFWDGRLYMSGYWDPSLYKNARKQCHDGAGCDDDPNYLAALEILWERLPQDPTTCSANFGATTYNWSVLQDDHDDDYPVAGDTEAAKLSHHAGIAVGMSYGRWGSGAGWTREGLVDYFRYDPDAAAIWRDVDEMVTDIQWFRPLEITGGSDTAGHSWMVCGYNKGTNPWQFLMNLGWGGGPTEWATIDEWFPNDQVNVIRIAPQGVVRFVGGSSGDGSPAEPYQDLPTALATVPDETTLVFKAGSTHTISGSPAVISKPVTLKGYSVTIAMSGP